jgi:hypothetical protein
LEAPDGGATPDDEVSAEDATCSSAICSRLEILGDFLDEIFEDDLGLGLSSSNSESIVLMLLGDGFVVPGEDLVLYDRFFFLGGILGSGSIMSTRTSTK